MNVTVNGTAAALQNDGRLCKGALPDTLIAGASTVTINGRPIVPALFPVSLHKALFTVGSSNVVVGGPIVVGDVSRWTKVCEAMRTTRLHDQLHMKKMYEAGREGRAALKPPVPRPYRPGQSTSWNCGCEVARQLVWGYGLGQPTEEEVLFDALDRGRAQRYSDPTEKTEDPNNWDVAGGTRAPGRQGILSDWGGSNAPPTENIGRSQEEVVAALGDGNQVILPIRNPGKHVVLATGVELDEQGRPVAIYVNDSDANAGGCGVRIPLDKMPAFDDTDRPTVVGRGQVP